MNDRNADAITPSPGAPTAMGLIPPPTAASSAETAAPSSGPPSDASRVVVSIYETIRYWTQAPANICSTLTFWALSTWFFDVLPVVPSLVISGKAHHGFELLRALQGLCAAPSVLSGFRKGDIAAGGQHTLLISAPHLSRDMAAFLASMTCSDVTTVNNGYLMECCRAVAIYVGESSPVGLIPYSISINVGTSERLTAPPRRMRARTQILLNEIQQYRTDHLSRVERRTFNPVGLSPEMTEVARSLGSCIVDDPVLQSKLIALLRLDDQRRLSNRSDTTEGIVVEAARSLSRKQPQHMFVHEIAVEANRLLELRGETIRLTPEKVGHRLRRVGLSTRRLNQSGNGLVLDRATIDLIDQLAGMYVEEDCVRAVEVSTSTEASDETEV